VNGAARRVLVLLMIGASAAGLIWIGLDLWAGRRVDREFARLEKRYGSLDGRSIVASPVAVEFNSARFVRAAVALTVRPAPTTSYSKLLASATSFEQQTAPSAEPEDVRAFVDSNRDAIQLALEARTRHQASWDADYAGGAKVPPLLDLRTLGNALAYAAILDIKRERPEDASANVAAGLAVAASLRREPGLLAQLIRISIALQQCEAVRSLVIRSEPSTAALQALARALVDSRETDPMRVGLRGELALQNAAFLKIERGEATDMFDLRESPFWFGRIGRPFVRLARLRYLQEMERLIDVEGGPRPRPPFPNRPRYARWDWRSLGSYPVAGLERAVESGDTHNSLLGVAEIGVALRRHRLDRGSYPDELTALVPVYLTRLPIDPVTGRPPAYARSGAGFTLKAETIRKDSSANAALEWVVAK
jgi:hypothetical protein